MKILFSLIFGLNLVYSCELEKLIESLRESQINSQAQSKTEKEMEDAKALYKKVHDKAMVTQKEISRIKNEQ